MKGTRGGWESGCEGDLGVVRDQGLRGSSGSR